MKPKTWIVVLALLLLGSNAFWLYHTIDFGVSYSYLSVEASEASKRAEQAVRLANLDLIGMQVSEAKTLIGNNVYDLEPFEKEGCLWAGNVCLRLDSDRNVVSLE